MIFATASALFGSLASGITEPTMTAVVVSIPTIGQA